ncbi:hypothetical protein HQN60_09190 [Deefgea piscis]|uniref:Uncharacterized protein n=1 Tax=Deefgea piscis TaxID=2739061 RepID=A0A6M8SQ61_9NEIS|nr:hypothetical protein [Deefgea piscis]QKJ66861.1 hypothetical protein HQN60_09190 [Deefgea piscis]
MLSSVAKDIYFEFRRLFPTRLLYGKEYFAVSKLLLDHDLDKKNIVIKSRLRETLYLALTKTKFYPSRVKLSAKDILNNDPHEMLALFPLLSKEEVVAYNSDFFTSKLQPKILRSSSGGSTGLGLVVQRSKMSSDVERAFYNYYWGDTGFSLEKSRVLRLGQDALVGLSEPPCRQQGNRLLISPTHIDKRNFSKLAEAIHRFSPDYIHGYPSCVTELAELYRESPNCIQIKAVFLASESIYKKQLAIIQDVFRCPIYISYGLSERTNIGFAKFIDGELSNYCFDDLYSVNEFICDDVGVQIVGTSLWNNAMPLIRYQTQDYVRKNNDAIVDIEGRLQNFLLAKDGSKIPSLILDDVNWEWIAHLQIAQKEPGKLTLYIKLKDGFDSVVVCNQIVKRQVDLWCELFDVEVVFCDELKRKKSGKSSFFYFD